MCMHGIIGKQSVTLKVAFKKDKKVYFKTKLMFFSISDSCSINLLFAQAVGQTK